MPKSNEKKGFYETRNRKYFNRKILTVIFRRKISNNSERKRMPIDLRA